MRFGLVQAFSGEPGHDAGFVRELAAATEAAGFDSMWIPEHLVLFESHGSRYPYPPYELRMGSRPGLLDALLTCQAIALSTTTMRVGTAVTLVPLRHPLVLAREVATLDHFSGGRFELGVGVGWLREEFDALGVDFARRGAITDEHLEAMRELWTADKSTYRGAHVAFEGVSAYPKPVQQPSPPLLIGGNTAPAFRRTARHGTGWFGWSLTPPELEVALADLDAALGSAGRTRQSCKVQLGITTRPTPEAVAAYRDLGVDELLVTASLPPGEHEARLERLMESLHA